MGSHGILQNNNNIIMEIERKDLSVGKIKAKELPIVCVLGGPGSGKGSQCEILSYKRNFKHLSSSGKGSLLERANFDDKEDSINKRCATFQNECRPVLEKYADKLLKVNANQDKESVAEEIASGCGF